MTANYQHLNIFKAPLQNDRRTRRVNMPRIRRGDLRQHGQMLLNQLQTLRPMLTQVPGSADDGRYILKLNYSGTMNFSALIHHGVEFVSQENKQVCVVFSDEQGLATFAEHLSSLGLGNTELTYKQILEALDGIEGWSAEDRKSWALRRYGFPVTERFKLDVELWPVEVAHHPRRIDLYTRFEQWLQEQGISRQDKVNLDSLLIYRVDVSLAQAEYLLAHRDVRLIDLPPSSGISYQQINRDINTLPDHLISPAAKASRVCILDSGINTNHPLLSAAIAESASFIPDQDAFDQEGHGTAVASIALYGDVEACNESNFWQPQLWLYNGKVLNERAEFNAETIESTLTTAVAYFTDLGCRIFNLSLGNVNAPYDGRHIRGMAYLLDTLARQYNVLFVVSAGNFSGSDAPPVPQNSWRDEYPDYLLHEASIIIDPAPALNVLTVGSVARHNATSDAQRRPDDIQHLCPATENQPSPFTRHGPSVKGAFKPDVVAHGGNVASSVRQGQWQAHMRGLGVLSCHHQFQGNTLFKELSGTSFAAPYITHLAGRLLNEYPEMSASMLRAMLVNHASVSQEMTQTFPEAMRESYKNTPATRNREIERDVTGYGIIDEDALYCSSENVVVMRCEEQIENNAHQFFELPFPASFLRSQRATREIRITLAYSPAVRTTRLDYTATRIGFRLVKGRSLDEVQASFNHQTQSETETRSDDAQTNRVVSAQQRERGTVQSSVWTFRQRNPDEKWFIVVTRQDRDWGEAFSSEQEPYALVVTATDRDNEQAQLYTQIQAQIREQERARARIG
ncbi:S8 family peptidase [Klebsiella quasipneumoniae]|uniref:S8 family peptidase n=1 Tax=Klebsiella quasipneumoniae TaxID=1463165 RepID=UPI00249BCE52|nr:S8 family peptidase [Klebsiella quasipneumoniae]MDI3072184.1 S8 family peptidase [Klebsiella quasipneumoniae]HBR1600098.1 S8 family peptidase [Klebsiella quasipneumoniae subsp. quasipneumoniae]